MGQNSSGLRPQGARFLDSDDERGFKPSGSTSPDFAFSSQVPASTDRHPPFTLSDVQQFKHEVSSSPTPPQPTPFSPVQASKVEATNSPSVTSSHHDLSAQSTRSKRKKRPSKKHSSSIRHPEDDTRPSLPRSPIDLDSPTNDNQMDEMAGELNDGDDAIPQVQGEFDTIEAPTPSDMLSEKEKRRQEKRERKAQKKAAKRLRLHSEGGDNTSSAQEHESLDIPDTTIPATVDSPIPGSDSHADVTMGALPEDPADPPATSSRKRKLNDSSDVEKAKKRKRSRGGRHSSANPASEDAGNHAGEDVSATGAITESQSQSHNSTHATSQSSAPSGNIDGTLGNLAERLYTVRKSTTSMEEEQRNGGDTNNDVQNLSPNHPRMEHGPQVSSSSSASTSNGVHPGIDSATSLEIPPIDEMDVDDSTGEAPNEDGPASESEHNISNSDEDHQENQMVVDDISQIDEEPEAHHDNDANEDYINDDAQDADSHSEPPSLAKADQPDTCIDDKETTDNELTNRVSDDQVEVPSSVPHKPNPSSEAGSSRQEQSKTSNGRKRVAKTPYYDRKTKDITDAFRELPSPSLVAASRRTNSHQDGKKDDNSAAGPSTAPANKKQRKISAMLKANNEDSSDSDSSTSPKPRSAGKGIQKAEGGSRGKKTGPFTDDELGDIHRAVERWREDHGMTQFQVNDLIQSHPKRARSIDMWECITAACPDRPRQKVINQCRRKFHNFVARGSWTEEQHEELTQLVALHGEKHAKIGKIINRHPEDVRDRIRNYVRCGGNRRSNTWDDAEEEKLKSIVLEAIAVIEAHREENREAQKDESNYLVLGDGPVEDLVDWTVVSERMGTRGRLQCITKWKRIKSQAQAGAMDADGLIHMIDEARETAEAMSHKDRYRVVKAIRSYGANADSRIPWARIRDDILGEEGGTRAVIMVVWHRLKLTVPDWKIMSTPEVAHQLIKEYRDTQKLEYPPDEDIDLDAESLEIERRFSTRLKPRDQPKTPHLVQSDDEDTSSSDDDGEDEKGDKNDDTPDQPEGEDDVMEDAPPAERASSVDLGLATAVISKDDELEIEDSEPEVKSRQSSNARDPRTELESDSSVDLPSVSNFKLHSARRSSKGYSEPGQAANTSRVTPGRFKKVGQKASTPSQVGKSLPNMSSSRKSSASRKRQKQRYDEIEEVSSDTNASDVESIPAH